MVIQRESNPAIWGWSGPNETVRIQFLGTTTFANSDASGSWMARLPYFKAGGPWSLRIENEDSVITINDVLIGDVWLASGQSNMQWAMEWGIDNMDAEIASALNKNIRFFTVGDALASFPQQELPGGSWVGCNPKNVRSFSAAAYYFARDLEQAYDIPIGVIHSSWGGTDIEAWMSAETLTKNPEFKHRLDTLLNRSNVNTNYEEIKKQNSLRDSIIDHSTNGISRKVFAPSYDDADWKVMTLPTRWDKYIRDQFYGYCWFRKRVKIDDHKKSERLVLNLGEMCCESIAYFNGSRIEPINSGTSVSYAIPGRLIRHGENIITLRVLGRWGIGSFDSNPQLLNSTGESIEPDSTFRLGWRYNERVEPQTPDWSDAHNYPSFIFNAKIFPLIPYSLKGIIWYQGENNTKRAKSYADLFVDLIIDWRTRWGQGYIPFIFSQLANYNAVKAEPSESEVAELRNAQEAGLKMPNTAMVVNIDLSKDGDIHFRNKKENGQRYATAAKGVAYNSIKVYSGPFYRSHRVFGQKVFVQFKNSDSGLVTKNNEPPSGFAIAGPNKVFFWAEARIQGNEVELKSENVPEPVYIRYGWADNPNCNLYNLEMLPAAPFKTD